MTAKKSLILVVDDDVRMLRMMKRTLELEGATVLIAGNGGEALKIFEEKAPDLVLLDIMLPDMDGYTMCQRIRDFSQVPVIMVTAKGSENEKVEGLNTGADDYITKPFSTNELTARVRAALRRAAGKNTVQTPTFRFQDMAIDFTSRRIMVANKEIKLTSTEYKVLAYLSHNAGRVVTPEQLLNEVWGEEYATEPHLLQVNIARLRQKLGDDAKNPTYILTRSGIGYMVPKPPQASPPEPHHDEAGVTA
jgi:DNA-binding response OmpR family regulator